MAIDTPAKLAMVGAGPIGLEAALYARFLGYDVVIFEQGRVCEHVQQQSHVRSFVPFRWCCSPLGLAAITAHDENYQPPTDDARLTGSEWLEQYLLPLAATDLLSDHLQLHTRVLGIGKEQVRKTDRAADLPAGDERGDWSFRLLVQDAAGNERIEEADAVLDCSGVLSQPNYCGHGGLPAIGERALRGQIDYRLPDLLGDERDRFSGKRTLLIGHGHSAATAAVQLAEIQQQDPATSFTWITRHEHQPATGPVRRVSNDPFPSRAELAAQANAIAQQANSWHWASQVEKIVREPGGPFVVSLSVPIAGDHSYDNILALVGYQPDLSLLAELQVEPDFATGGLRDPGTKLIQPEDNFYLLGAKSFGRQTGFLFRDGLAQIQQLFAILGDRPTLDLYAAGQPKLE
ncbi:Ferredoxin--NADP reductase [Anatilimnocola aggregata]|uniref:Ferredoxin--NADP reductase n=1 Tax=Anatilimnocola aggregata TaxID=2528021 RepID=A0A517Y4T6_9BACT|nr:hypothetical protein [Anatilimnocola aggregata]QDU25253.1 Ferredoxin--NADP reductase [Anatilimnocola aggregata]